MAKEQNPENGEKELTLAGIQQMKKAEILKEFKANKNVWRNASKCKAVIFLLAFDKNSDKKKITIALPFKKESDMRNEFKELKKSKLLPMAKVAAGVFTIKSPEAAAVSITNGGANIEMLKKLAGKLFEGIKMNVSFATAADYEAEAPDSSSLKPEDMEDDAEEPTTTQELSAKPDKQENVAPKSKERLAEEAKVKNELMKMQNELKGIAQALKIDLNKQA